MPGFFVRQHRRRYTLTSFCLTHLRLDSPKTLDGHVTQVASGSVPVAETDDCVTRCQTIAMLADQMRYRKRTIAFTLLMFIVITTFVSLRLVRPKAFPDATLVFESSSGGRSTSPLFFGAEARFGDASNDFDVSWSYAGGLGVRDLYRFQISHWRVVSTRTVSLYVNEDVELLLTATEQLALSAL